MLLKFEKRLAALAAFVAAGSATAASASSKIDSEKTVAAYQEIKEALAHLADVTAGAHRELEQAAIETGVRMLNIGGGLPKDPPPIGGGVRSLLGLG